MVNIIVHMEFLSNELLLVLFSQGQEWLVDPHTARVTKHHLIGLLDSELIKSARVCEDRFAVLTSKCRFLYIKNVRSPVCEEYADCSEELIKIMHPCWSVFMTHNHLGDRMELHLAHHEAGLFQLQEPKPREPNDFRDPLEKPIKLYYNRQKSDNSKLPYLSRITYISEPSPNKKSIAYFVTEAIYKNVENPQNMKRKKDSDKAEPPAK
jgi:hypothetical protein